jgi:RPE1 domain-containing protein
MRCKLVNHITRVLAKLADVRGFVGDTERRTGAYSMLGEDPSTGSTHKSPTAVEFCKNSTHVKAILNRLITQSLQLE